MRTITPKELSEALQLVGWKLDKGGHLQKSINLTRPHDGFPLGKTTLTHYRIRTAPESVFIETKKDVTPTAMNPARKAWVIESSTNYSDVEITQSSQIRIGNKKF